MVRMKRLSLILLLAAALAAASCSSKKATVVTRPKTPSATTATVKVVPSTDKQLKQLIAEARSWIGTPYAYGGSTKRKGTDCSGMIMQIFNEVYDLRLPRSSAMQHEVARPVRFDNMKPGDLVFFTTSKNSRRVNHVGLYVGDNRMIHASSSRGVMESSLAESYWKNAYHSSGCVIETDPKAKRSVPALPRPAPSIPLKDIQKLYNALDEQIDSIYVANPEIFD